MSKFNSQVCTSIEQSKRLLELGLNPETADCTFAIINGEPVAFIGQTKIDCSKITINGNEIEKKEIIHYPAWSLHRLMMLGNLVNIGIPIIENAYDACIRLIEEQIRFGMFNKEYLKQ